LVANPDKSLAEILGHRMQTGEPIPVRLTLSILRQVCEALDWAHNLRDPAGQPLGIVHRDVSPANIFISEAGLVRLIGSTAQRPNCAYMAPETVTAGIVDARADLFALGVVAHEMLANRPLFAGADDRETLERVCTLAIPSPSSTNANVAPDIDSIVLMALARDPTYRWQHAAMMRDGFQSVAERLGLGLGPAHANAWVTLLAGRLDPKPDAVLPSVSFAAPRIEAPVPADQWTDDHLETEIRNGDPSLLDDDPPTVDAAPAAKQPRAPTADVDAFVATVPAPKPAPKPAPAFELEIPEATQVGAVPLISFGESSIGVIGQPPPRPRPSKPTLPPPIATFLPEATVAPPQSRKRIAIIVASVALVVVSALVTLLVVAD
jgi:hypothetical protein